MCRFVAYGQEARGGGGSGTVDGSPAGVGVDVVRSAGAIVASGERRAVTASGDGAIAAGGTVGSATTRIVLPTQPAPDGSGSVRPAGVVASGKGAIAAGGDVHEARTEVHVSDGTLDS